LEHIESHGQIQHFVPGAIIFEAGETSDDFFLVLKGAVEVIQHGERKQVVARLGPGQYFGELGLHKGAMHTVTVRAAPDAAGNVQVVSIDRQALAELVKVSDMTEVELGRMLRQQFMERES
jgi:thioredoxin reductase (NADPH)